MDLLQKAFWDIYTNPHKLNLVCEMTKDGEWYFAVLFDQDDYKPILVTPAGWSSKCGAVDRLKELLEQIVAQFDSRQVEFEGREVLTNDLILQIIGHFSESDSVSVARLPVIA